MSAKSKRLLVLVSNDLNHDQRVLKTCRSLTKMGWEISLVGRDLPDSSPLQVDFDATRLKLPFHRGALFYASLQIALYCHMRKRSVDAIWANDLDTLLPAFVISQQARIPLVYDSHEFFTEAAGLTGRRLQRGVWLVLERILFPKLKAVITVNNSIAQAYAARYPQARGGMPLVVRNMPERRDPPQETKKWRQELNIPKDATFLILQGAFLDQDRGVKQAVEALREREDWALVVVGAGAEFDWAKDQVHSLSGRLICLPKMPFEELRSLTAAADVGLSLDRGVHGNYWMSLPNKLFDYIHAGIPVVASAMPEVRQIIESFGIGCVAIDHAPSSIISAVQEVVNMPTSHWKSKCRDAAQQLHWEAEELQIERALSKAGAP